MRLTMVILQYTTAPDSRVYILSRSERKNEMRTRPTAIALALLGALVFAPFVFAHGQMEKSSSSSSSSAKAVSISAVPMPAMPTKQYTFELITKSNASPYWLAVREGAFAAAKKYGVTVKFEAPASGTDLATQISMVNNAVTAGVDGIILAAQNPKALLQPVRSAMSAHIPVVTVDSGLTPNISDSFLATENVAAAAALAKYTANHLMGDKGQYGIVDFNHTASTGILRPQGFELGMKSFPNIKMDGKVQYSQNSISKGESLADTMLVQYPNLKVIYGANDRSALGPAEAVAASNSNVKIVGFDADLGEIKFIKDGIIQASILQSPYNMGYYGVLELLDVHQGKKVPKRVNTGFFLLTPKDLATAKATAAIQQYAPSYKG